MAAGELDLNEKLALLDLLTHAHAQADAYFETIGDAAALAANQVQDVRLEYLEKGPTITLSDAFIDLLLAVTIQYAGDRILVDVTKNLLTRLLSIPQAFLLIGGRTERGKAVADVYKAFKVAHTEVLVPTEAAKFNKALRENLGRHILGEGGAKALYTDLPFTIAEVGTKVVWHTGRQTGKLKSNPTHLSSGDSPAVAVLDNAQVYVLRQKTFQRALFEGMKNLLLVSPLGRDDVDMLFKTLAPFATPLSDKLSLTEIKQHYKLFFEACIWSRILDPRPTIKSAADVFEKLPEGVERMGITDVGKTPYLDIGGRGPDLTEYLLDRIVSPETGQPFREEVYEFRRFPRAAALEQGRGVIEQGEPLGRLRSRYGDTSHEIALDKMLDHFDRLRTKSDELESRLPPEGRSQWHDQQAGGREGAARDRLLLFRRF